MEKPAEDSPWHSLLVIRNRKPGLSDVKDSLRRAPVAFRVVQHPLPHPVRPENRRAVAVFPLGQRECTGDPMTMQDQRVGGETQRLGQIEVGEVRVQEGLDALIRWTRARAGIVARRVRPVRPPIGDSRDDRRVGTRCRG